jgi:hypothetical protein
LDFHSNEAQTLPPHHHCGLHFPFRTSSLEAVELAYAQASQSSLIIHLISPSKTCRIFTPMRLIPYANLIHGLQLPASDVSLINTHLQPPFSHALEDLPLTSLADLTSIFGAFGKIGTLDLALIILNCLPDNEATASSSTFGHRVQDCNFMFSMEPDRVNNRPPSPFFPNQEPAGFHTIEAPKLGRCQYGLQLPAS